MLWQNIFVLSITSLASSAMSSPLSLGAAVAAPQEPAPEDPPTSIIDILSSNIQYLYFLRQLQRNGLVPFINQLENVTLLAPVNLAFAKTISNVNAEFEWDNNELLRYVIDQVMCTDSLGNDSVVYNTYYKNKGPYPLLVSKEADGYVIDQESMIVEPDIYALHQGSYIQGIDQFLLMKPSICEFLLAKDVDEVNGNGIGFVKKCFKQLFNHETDLLTSNKKKSKKNSKKSKKGPLPESCQEFMNNTKTLFIPTDDYIYHHLLALQIEYYTSLFDDRETSLPYETTKEALYETKYDILRLLENLMLGDLVGGVNGTNHHSHLSISGKVTYDISGKANARKICLNKSLDSIKESSNIVLSDGVIHLFGYPHEREGAEYKKEQAFFLSFDVPTAMIARKALYALHFSNHVEEFYFRKLDYLIDGSTGDQTIVLNLEGRDDVPDDEVGVASFSAKQVLLYQMLDLPASTAPTDIFAQCSTGSCDNLTMADLSGSTTDDSFYLVNTKLCSKKRIGGCFKSKVYTNSDSVFINDMKIVDSVSIANNSKLYFATKENPAPLNLKLRLVEVISGNSADSNPSLDMDSSSCLDIFKDIQQSDLLSLDENGKGYSIFLPCGRIKSTEQTMHRVSDSDPWNSLGLILIHFKRNPKILAQVLKGFFLQGTIYSDFQGKGKFQTLNQETISVELLPSVLEEDHKSLIFNDSTTITIPLNSDILFNQGVVHITNELLLPQDLTISMLDLIKTTYDSSNESWSILQLIELYPQIFSKLMGKSNEFSLLVPTAESLASFNITNSFDKLIQFIEFHIIPNAELDKMLGCISQAHTGNFLSIRTNYSDTTLNCRTESGKTILQLNSPNHMLHSFGYNKDHEVHIVNHGCTRGHGTGCVFLIDKPLNLAWLEKPSSNFLHVSLGIVSLGIGIIFGLVIFGIVMLGVAMCVNNKQKQMGGVITTGGSDFLSGGRLEPSFMSVRDSSDDNIYDRGYETDDDMLRSEHEQLLPTENRRRGSRRSFGASSVGGKHSYGLFLTDGNGSTRESSRSPTGPTGPLPISSKSITNTLNRERNLPGVV